MSARFAYKVISLVVLFSLVCQPLTVLGKQVDQDTREQGVSAPAPETGLYRTTVTVDNPTRRARLEALGVVVLASDQGAGDSGQSLVTVLADGDHLETLARLGFRPQASDDLAGLSANAAPEKAWLVESLKPLLAQAEIVQAQRSAAETAGASAAAAPDGITALRAAMQALTPEQAAGIAGYPSNDFDGDGLTDTEEAWWCTDPQNPNSDGDANGYTDGQEVDALLDFTRPREVRWGYGPPFVAWPPFVDTIVPGATPTCLLDADHDSIPDLAETYMVGTRVPLESSDRDKFDDGQELFGVTYCTPAGTDNCGWGLLPRNEDYASDFITEEMPRWVRPPGDHPLVAAFPVPDVSVLEGTWKVERVTTITTQQGQMTQATKTYGSEARKGQRTSVADTQTWNEWEEVSEAIERPMVQAANTSGPTIKRDVTTVVKRTLKAGSDIPELSGQGIGQLAGGLICSVIPGMVLAAPVCALAGGIAGKLLEKPVGDLLGLNKDEVQVQATYNDNSVSQIQQNNFNTDPDSESMVGAVSGLQYAINQQGQMMAQGFHDMSLSMDRQTAVLDQGLANVANAILAPRITETRSNGKSWGGSQTVTNEEYEEHALTEQNGFTTGENWSTAWAVDSSRAATLDFAYTVRNTGTEYARELAGLTFNVYLNDELISSYPAWQQFTNGKLENLFPADPPIERRSNPIPLTLEQMKQMDNGGKLRIVVADYSYGADEPFYNNAINGGMTIYIEDGVEDGDETVDMYVIPTWGTESVQDVLTRYFPADYDADDLLNSLSTPEFDGVNPPVFHEHYLSNLEWWNIYSTQPDAADLSLRDLPAQTGHTMLIRMSRDSDRDGYQDRVEQRYGTDKDDAASHPNPDILAGYVVTRAGNQATVALALENNGTFDAYGVQMTLYSPDDTTTVTDNVVGGNGRVRTGRHVAVGSVIEPPTLSNWSGSTARPYATGDYAGPDRTFTFTVSSAGTVGTGSTAMTWTDGAGGTGTLNLGSSYHAPLPLAVRDGLQIGFDSGVLAAGNSFTVKAFSPRDTLRYTINTDPNNPASYTEPVIVVSYNDPQGNTQFVTPVKLTTLGQDLAPFSGQMLTPLEFAIRTHAAVTTAASNTTSFLLNNPHTAPILGAKVHLDFITDGTRVLHLSRTLNVQPGPNVVDVAWNTSEFAQPYDPAKGNILIADWTDSENNIIDSAVRPLNLFLPEANPTFSMSSADATWDFGTAAQGTLLKRSFTFANTGALDLLTYVSAPAGLTVSQTGSRRVGPADMTTYEMALNTASLPIGAYTGDIIIRTSDPANSTRTVHVVGTVTAAPADTPVGAVQRPLDWPAPVSGMQGQWVEFTHTLGPEPQTLHPVKVWSQDYATLKGVGRYATPFGAGTASYEMFGDGRDGALIISTSTTDSPIASACTGAAGSVTLYASNPSFAQGQVVFIHQSQYGNAGLWDRNTIQAYSAGAITLGTPLKNTYTTGAQVQVLRQYTNVTINSSAIWKASAWNGSTGGILAFLANGTLTVNGSIMADGRGFRGARTADLDPSISGEGTLGPSARSLNTNGNGAGATGHQYDNPRASGSGGGNGAAGNYGSVGRSGNVMATPGSAWGAADLTSMVFGGGGSAASGSVGAGGDGGGIIFATAAIISNNGSVTSNGTSGTADFYNDGGGGGGAGGSILLKSQTLALGTNQVWASGGAGGVSGSGSTGGSGGIGRIHVDYCNTVSGSTTPTAHMTKLDCYVAEQVETAPYTHTRLNLPETGTHTYQVQYGRRLNWSGADNRFTTLRVPAGLFTSVTVQALVSDLPSNAWFALDVGNTGSDSWNGTVGNGGEYTSPNLAPWFNAYWASHGAPTTGTLDVPVRMYLDRAGQVLLTNLQVTPTGSKTRYIRLLARPQGYSNVTLNSTVSGGSGPLTVGVDVGADGSVDWPKHVASPAYPASLTSDNLAAAINAYLAGKSGEVDVPLRFTLSPFATLNLTGFIATPVGQPDAGISVGDITFSAPTPTEGNEVTVNATLHNGGTLDTGPLTASFYATPAGGAARYIGSQFVSNVAPAGTETVPLQWNTLGFTGDTSVQVTVDPFNRVAEASEANNQAAASLTIKTRPDLVIPTVILSDAEPVAGEPVAVTVNLANNGQTDTADFVASLADGESQVGSATISLSAAASAASPFAWTPAVPGLHRLAARADRDRQVNESDEGNNDRWLDVYVGFAGPLLLDSGGITQDPSYTPMLGYGVVDEGQPDVLSACSPAASPADTFRRDPAGRVVYRFDHLLPGHFYHLDTTLYECDGAHRQETVKADGNALLGPVDLSDGQVHRFSTRLDPALYADRSISVTVEAPGINGAVVSQVNLYDVDYRYADAGATGDLTYSALRGYGWLDGVANAAWGGLPYQNVRVNQSGNALRYRFDSLAAAKRYQVNLTFFQGDAVNVIEEVLVDGLATGVVANLSDRQPHYLLVDVPVEAYRGDGNMVVTIRRTNGATGAFANEISLEEKTLLNLPVISDVRVTNVTADRATISWLTDAATDGAIHYGPTAALGGIVLDERGAPVSSRTHQVTLVGLAPQTTYRFYAISSDTIDDQGGAYYAFTTGPAFAPNPSDLAFGRVLRSDGTTPAAGALVRAKISDADAQGSPGDSASLSALADGSGYWSFDLAATRTTDYSQLFEYGLAGDRLLLEITDGTGCTASQIVDTGLDAPAPDMILVCPTQATHTIANGWTLLALNVQADPAPTAEAMLDDIVAQGGNAIEIERWWNGGWDAHVRDLPFNNFTLTLGRGYFVRTGSASAWTRTGLPLVAPPTLNLYSGWNLIGLPKFSGSLLAEDLLVGIAAQGGACSEIDRWINGGWLGHPKSYPVNNFAIATTEGYFVKCTKQSAFTPGAVSASSRPPTAPPAAEHITGQPAAAPVIYDVLVTNRRDVAFTVSWRTDQPSKGWIEYGPPGVLGLIERDPAGSLSTLHHITVADLSPETVYAYRVHSGDQVADKDGQPFQVMTAATTSPGVPLTAFGQVLDSADRPIIGALVRAWLEDGNGARSEPLSTLTEGDGYWGLSLLADACADRQLLLEVFAADGATAQRSGSACDVQPAPALTVQLPPRRPIYLPMIGR